MPKNIRSKSTGISVKRETPLILFGAGILIVIVILVSFFPMTWNVKDEEYIKDIEKRVSDLERKMAEAPLLPEKPHQSDESNRVQMERQIPDFLKDFRKLETSLTMQTKIIGGRVDELQSQVDELRLGMARNQRRPDVIPQRKNVQPNAVKTLPDKKNSALHYVVRQGDTFYSISKSYGLSLKKLRELNKFDDKTKIYPGQSIVVGP